MSVMKDDDTGGGGKVQVSAWLEEATIAAIEADLDYSDSKSEWIREACRRRLAREREHDAPDPRL